MASPLIQRKSGVAALRALETALDHGARYADSVWGAASLRSGATAVFATRRQGSSVAVSHDDSDLPKVCSDVLFCNIFFWGGGVVSPKIIKN